MQDEIFKIFRISESLEPEPVGDIARWDFVALLKLSFLDCFLLSHYGPGTYRIMETERGNFILVECLVKQDERIMDTIRTAVNIEIQKAVQEALDTKLPKEAAKPQTESELSI